MNKALFSFLFLITAYTASSQRVYFIYLQTESQQPFFVKMGEKVNSSTASGYLILPRLRDSTYDFSIGFPGNQAGEQQFSCTINKKDHGYLVKNFGEKGWGLVDLQTQTVQMAANHGKKDGSAMNVPVNAFTDLLARAADDSTLRQKIVLPEEKKPEALATVIEKKPEAKETVTTKVETTQTEKTASQDAGTVAVNKATGKDNRPGVDTISKKNLAKTNAENLSKKNIVKEGPKTAKPSPDTTSSGSEQQPAAMVMNDPKPLKAADSLAKKSIVKEEPKTVRSVAEPVNSPVENRSTAPAAREAANTGGQQAYTRTRIIRKAESSTTEGFGLTFIDVQADGQQDTIRITIPQEGKTAAAEDLLPKKTAATDEKGNGNAATITPAGEKAANPSSCRQVASEDDFYRLRKKMAAGKSDNDMMSEAARVFRTKCFTTAQIKNLGSLFLGDGGKYNFFDAAYTHVTDTANFPSLQSELKDEYFINRFRSMLR